MAVAETSRSVGKGRSSGCKLKTRACPRSSPNPVASSIYVFNRLLAHVAYSQEAINSIATGDAALAPHFGGDTVDAGNNGTLNLNNASTETSQSSSHTGSDLVRQEMQGQGSQQESGHANVLNAGQLQVNAAKINVPLAQSLQQLTQQPGMGYLNQLLNDPALQGKVNWSAVELAHQHWDYAHEGLSPTGAVIVAIVVAYCTAGTASGAGEAVVAGVGATGTTATVVAGATAAAVTTLATQASISLINNQGDIGKTLNDLDSSDSVKALVTVMVSVAYAKSQNDFASVDEQSGIRADNGGFNINV